MAPILRFVLRNGKPLAGVLVELGTFVYVIDVKVEDKPTRVILHKHAIDYVLLGDV
jgi:sRNA-binding regulator protein Hfq